MQFIMGNKDDAGLGLFNCLQKDKALKINWIRNWDKLPISITKLAMYHIKPKLATSDFWLCKFKKADIKYVCNLTGFWQDVVTDWSEISYHQVTSVQKVLQQIIWLNSHIRV